MKNKLLQFWGELKPREIQSTIMIAFSFISIFLMLIMGLVMYNRFVNASREENVQNTQKLIEQTGKESGGLSGEHAPDFRRRLL